MGCVVFFCRNLIYSHALSLNERMNPEIVSLGLYFSLLDNLPSIACKELKLGSLKNKSIHCLPQYFPKHAVSFEFFISINRSSVLNLEVLSFSLILYI